jgi:hypothetical protein
MRRKSVCTTAKQRTEAARWRSLVRRLFEGMRARWNADMEARREAAFAEFDRIVAAMFNEEAWIASLTAATSEEPRDH